jgi:hypothetical protein
VASDILDLDSPSLRTRGRAKRPLAAEVTRELSPADLALLEVSRGSRPPKLMRLRDSHHRLAQVLAVGATPGEAGSQTGYSQSRISILLADKSFQDLVEVYRRDSASLRAEYADMATANMIRGERIIEDALEQLADASEPVSLANLRPVLDIVSDRADRFGYPKKATNVNINVDFAGKLEAARRRSGLIDVTPVKEPAT